MGGFEPKLSSLGESGNAIELKCSWQVDFNLEGWSQKYYKVEKIKSF